MISLSGFISEKAIDKNNLIDIDKYHEWLDNPSMMGFSMLAVGYDPERRNIILENNLFDDVNTISDRKKFLSILTDTIDNFAGNNFSSRLKYPDTPWFIYEENTDPALNELLLKVKEYLDSFQWPNDRYFGQLDITDPARFLSIFIDYPLRMDFQDIYLNSKDIELLIVLSSHGTVWFISNDNGLVDRICIYLVEKGATVIKSK